MGVLMPWRLARFVFCAALCLESVESKAQPMLEIKVTDGRAGGAIPLDATLDHHEIEEGPGGFMVEDRHRAGLCWMRWPRISTPTWPARPL